MPDARRSAAAVTFAHCPNHLSYVSDKGYPRFRGAVAAAPQLCSLSATSCYGRRVPALVVLWDIDHPLIDSGGAEVHVYQLVLRDLFGRDLPDLVPFATSAPTAIPPSAAGIWFPFPGPAPQRTSAVPGPWRSGATAVLDVHGEKAPSQALPYPGYWTSGIRLPERLNLQLS